MTNDLKTPPPPPHSLHPHNLAQKSRNCSFMQGNPAKRYIQTTVTSKHLFVPSQQQKH